MTPGARLSAACEILAQIIAQVPAEKALTGWARASRFAGSKDRAAIRDHVFDALRNLRSYACLGGGSGAAPDARSVIVGLARTHQLCELFDGQGHAPAPLSAAENAAVPACGDADRWNLPDWLADHFAQEFGPDAEKIAQSLSGRAPISLRVNLPRISRDDAIRRLGSENVICAPNPLADTALTVSDGARGIIRSACYAEGLVELQDAASQAVVAALDGVQGADVLDFCAGGGGKALALAAAGAARVSAQDVDPARMQDIPARAARAGVSIIVNAPDHQGRYDMVLVDAPCSGSGAWRRSPEAKWRFTPDRLAELGTMQRQILTKASDQVAAGGTLAYVTCSILSAENEHQADWLANRSGWREIRRQRWDVGPDGDGFFLTQLYRED